MHYRFARNSQGNMKFPAMNLADRLLGALCQVPVHCGDRKTALSASLARSIFVTWVNGVLYDKRGSPFLEEINLSAAMYRRIRSPGPTRTTVTPQRGQAAHVDRFLRCIRAVSLQMSTPVYRKRLIWTRNAKVTPQPLRLRRSRCRGIAPGIPKVQNRPSRACHHSRPRKRVLPSSPRRSHAATTSHSVDTRRTVLLTTHLLIPIIRLQPRAALQGLSLKACCYTMLAPASPCSAV